MKMAMIVGWVAIQSESLSSCIVASFDDDAYFVEEVVSNLATVAALRRMTFSAACCIDWAESLRDNELRI